MSFLKDLLRNFLILGVIRVVLFLLFPDMMKQVYGTFEALFGLFVIIILLLFSLPRKRRARRA